MDLRQIQYFLALYDEKSVTRAAKVLNIVQPALSMQIAKLERDVGKSLFIRTARGMLPTPAADEMHALFTPILAEFSRVRSRVVADPAILSGHVRLGTVASVGHGALPVALLSFTASHPNVTLSIAEGMTVSLSQAVAEGQLDLAVVNRPTQTKGLTIEPIFEEPIVLVSQGPASVGLPSSLDPKELTSLKFVMPTNGHGLRRLLDEGLHNLHVKVTPAIEVDSLLTQALLVGQGEFVALLPESVVRNIQNRTGIRLRIHKINGPSLTREMVWVQNAKRPLSAAVQAFRKTVTIALLKAIVDPLTNA